MLEDLQAIYEKILEEGIEEKIPKLLGLVRPDVENKENYIRWVAETFDPSHNAAYITWILRMLKQNIIRGEEDAEKIKQRLSQFEELKKKPQFPKDKRDINSYKTYGDLAKTLDEYSGIKSKGEVHKVNIQKGVTLIDQIGDYKLYLVTTPEAASKLFRNTEWCVKAPKFFKEYGAPYYFFTQNDEPSTLLHLSSNQSKDVYDDDTALSDIQKKLMSSNEVLNYIIKNDNSFEGLIYYMEMVDYNDNIKNYIEKQFEEFFDKNKNNKILKVDGIDFERLVSGDIKATKYQPSASGHIQFDFKPFYKKLGKKLKPVLKEILGDWIRPMDFISLSMDGVDFRFTLYEEENREGEYDSPMYERFESISSIVEEIENMGIDKLKNGIKGMLIRVINGGSIYEHVQLNNKTKTFYEFFYERNNLFQEIG